MNVFFRSIPAHAQRLTYVLWGNNYIFFFVVVVANTAKHLSSVMYLSVHIFSLNLGQSSPKKRWTWVKFSLPKIFHTFPRRGNCHCVTFLVWSLGTENGCESIGRLPTTLGLGGWNRSKLCISHTGGMAPGMATFLQVLFWVFLGLC